MIQYKRFHLTILFNSISISCECPSACKVNVNSQRSLLAHFEVTLDSIVIPKIHANDNISQICYGGQISSQSNAVNCSFSDNLTPLRPTIIFC